MDSEESINAFGVTQKEKEQSYTILVIYKNKDFVFSWSGMLY